MHSRTTHDHSRPVSDSSLSDSVAPGEGQQTIYNLPVREAGSPAGESQDGKALGPVFRSSASAKHAARVLFGNSLRELGSGHGDEHAASNAPRLSGAPGAFWTPDIQVVRTSRCVC